MSEFQEKENKTTAPPPEEKPAQAPQPPSPRQYWSGQDKQREQQGPVQQPYDPYSTPYQGQRYQGAQNNGSYPYTPGTGSGFQPPQQQWSFQDYERLDGNGGKKPKKKRGLMVFAMSILGVMAVALVVLAGVNLYYSLTAVPQDNVTDPGASAAEEEDDTEAANVPENSAQMELNSRPPVDDPVSADGRLTIPQVAKKLLPSVVSIENFMASNFFEAAGLGSGIIMSEDGYIVTNQHVIADASALRVTLNNGDTYEAVVIGEDARTDLAIIKIDANGLVPAEFGDSNELEVGETVIAVGNPASLELAGSVTRGIVSALNRQHISSNDSMEYIQTDAAINPGNSGGALANEFGQVIGINSLKVINEGFEGIGFAIPISEAKPIIDDLLANGRVTGRVKLGITARVVDEIASRNYGIPMGLMIQDIEPESDIAAKGVQVRDIVTHINGERIFTFEELRAELDKHKVGQTVTLTLYRQSGISKGNEFEISVTLMEDMG